MEQNAQKEREKILEIKNLCMEFPAGKKKTVKALNNVTFDIYKGENFGLVGESGCGKTTLGRTLIRLYNPTSGEILFNGKNISGKLSKADRDYVTRNLSMIFQDPVSSLNPRMTVEEIIAEGLKTRGEKDKELIRKSVSSILNKVGLLPEHGSRYPHEFSGGQSHQMIGRPGLNPLRSSTRYHVDPAHYEMAQELVKVTKVNAEMEFEIRNGYFNPLEPGVLPFGNAGMFILDEKNWIESIPNQEDMKRITDEIAEARKQADVVFVSFHGHETDGEDTTVPAMFLETFSRACIDAGAHAVIGHGPHELRGIEIYKGGLILYSLGNFLFETETVSLQPYDAYINRKMPLDTKVGSYMDNRSKNGTVGYGVLENIWRAVMAAWDMEDGKITQVQLYPITLGLHDKRPHKGLPRMSGSEETLRYLQQLSEPYGTKIRIENGVGYIDLQE